MSSAGYIYVRNWEQRQHHKYDSPPWHKVYNNTLRDDDYLALSLADRGLLQDLWSLASLSGDGKVSADPTFLARQLNVRRARLDALIEHGFITIAGRSKASRAHVNRPKSDVDMRASVDRDPLEMQPSVGRDSPTSPNDAASDMEIDTDRVRTGSHSVDPETEKSREEKREKPPTVVPPATPPANRPRNEQWDALASVFGYSPRMKAEQGFWGKLTTQLRDAGATTTTIHEAARRYQQDMPGATMTPVALVKHYDRLMGDTWTPPTTAKNGRGGAADTIALIQAEQRSNLGTP